MKKIITFCLCLCTTVLWAQVTDYTYSTSHTMASVISDPLDFCYPPNLQPPQPFKNYFASDRCYYRYNNDCAGAKVLQFNNPPTQQQNAKFFQMCNNTHSSQQQIGPEFLFYVNSLGALTGCIILATDFNAPQPNQTTISVLNQAQGSSTHAPGCDINEITVFDLQQVAQGSHLYQVTCLSLSGGSRTSTALDSDLSATLTNHYTECPTSYTKQ